MEEAKGSTMRQEQKPGLLSDWASADSAGLRTLSSPLIEFVSNEYIAGRSEAESAIAIRTNWARIDKILEPIGKGFGMY